MRDPYNRIFDLFWPRMLTREHPKNELNMPFWPLLPCPGGLRLSRAHPNAPTFLSYEGLALKKVFPGARPVKPYFWPIRPQMLTREHPTKNRYKMSFFSKNIYFHEKSFWGSKTTTRWVTLAEYQALTKVFPGARPIKPYFRPILTPNVNTRTPKKWAKYAILTPITLSWWPETF